MHWWKLYNFNAPYLVPSKTDYNSKIPAQYKKFACNDYVTPASHAEDDYNLAHIVSTNCCKYLSIYSITA